VMLPMCQEWQLANNRKYGLHSHGLIISVIHESYCPNCPRIRRG